MNCPDYRPFHGSGYRQAPSSCRSTAKSPQRRSPAPAATMAGAASGGGEAVAPTSVAVSETDDPRRRTRQQLRSRRAERRSGAAAAAIPASGAAVGRGRRAWRPAATPDRGTPPLPKAAVPAPPKAEAHHLRRLRCQRPPPWRETFPEQPVPPPADGARRRDIKRILAVFPRCERFVRQFAADNDPQTPFSPTFSPEITDAPVQAGNYRQQGIFGSRFRRKVRRFFTMLPCKSSLCAASAALRREVIARRPSP